MNKKMEEFVSMIRQDPAVDNVVAYTGGGQRNSGTVFVMLKPLAERKVSAQKIIDRLKERLAGIAGARLSLQASQDISIGARQSSAQYQYTVEADDLTELRTWTPKIASVFLRIPEIKDVSTDQQTKGIETQVTFDRDTMYRLGLTPALVDSALNDAYGQRLVSNIHNPLNQYHVVMEVDESYRQSPEELKTMQLISPRGEVVPLAAFAQMSTVNTALAVSHQGQFAASTISFNLKEGVSLSEASKLIRAGIEKLNPPDSVHGGFEGTAKLFEESLKNQPLLVGFALIAIYIVLGMLYESYIHPITILSTIPSAGTGALLMMLLLKTEFTVIAFIGITLLVGIVMKNAIMMIDFAIEIEREDELPANEAIYQACLLRFRPILMTTLTALFGALPLAVGTGDGAELRQPLGICIVGGLLVSQVLTLYSTPVIYMYFDELRVRLRKWRRSRKAKAKLQHA